jgi:hypothetical protein
VCDVCATPSGKPWYGVPYAMVFIEACSTPKDVNCNCASSSSYSAPAYQSGAVAVLRHHHSQSVPLHCSVVLHVTLCGILSAHCNHPCILLQQPLIHVALPFVAVRIKLCVLVAAVGARKAWMQRAGRMQHKRSCATLGQMH